MPFVLLLLSVATLVAMSSKSKAASSGGRPQTFTLDVNMPDVLRNQVLAALVSGTDPAALDAFATAIQAQYPLSAVLLHERAVALRVGITSLPPFTDPGGPPLDPTMPAAMVAFVHAELANETDAIKLVKLAGAMTTDGYPIAASLLAERAAVLNVQPHPAPPPVPVTPQPVPVTPAPATPPATVVAPPPSPPATNPSAPALNMPGLDPGMPPELAQAVMTALIEENDPAKLQSLSQQLHGQYPLAANLLATKANTLLALRPQPAPAPSPQPAPAPWPAPAPVPSPEPPAPQPTPVVVPGFPSGTLMGMDAGMPPETVQLVLNELANEGDPVKLQALADQLAPQYPIAAALVRTRANVILATRPPIEIIPSPPSPSPAPAGGATYAVQQGDYPWKIAAKLTGHGARWPELVAANPSKPRAKDGNFASLLPGEKLNLPGSWSAAPQPAHAPAPVAATPSTPPAAPPHPPAPIAPPADGALDADMPPDVAAAVRNALTAATDPNQLRGFASAIAPKYPKAADLLNARANTLPPTAAPNGIVLASTGPAGPPTAPATYKVKAGDSPAKIAAAIVHDGNRWKELVAANPQKKRAASGNFASLLPGEVLQLPPSWVGGGAPLKSQQSPQGGV